MKERDSTMEPGDRILPQLQRYDGTRPDQLLGNIPYYLARAILGHHAFETIESLIVFCEDPDNLQPWLPSETDRIVFSNELVQRLREIRSDAPISPQTAVETGWPRSVASSNA